MSLYNGSYFSKMYSTYAATARSISKVRWDFVADVNPKVTLNYGSGCNFLALYSPENVIVDSYDIGTLNGDNYPQTGILHDQYNLIFFHDVLEHVDWATDPDEKIEEMLSKTNYISVSVPILPEGKQLEDWKHYKPGEHLTYFTEQTLDVFFISRGFEKVKSGYVECPPRVDILSALYKKALPPPTLEKPGKKGFYELNGPIRKMPGEIHRTPMQSPPKQVEESPRKLILAQRQAPGDILTMTNSVGDLKRSYPNYLIDVRSPAPEIWLNNPHLTPLDDNDPAAEHYTITYDDIHISGWNGLHFTDAFRNDIERKLNSNPEMVAKWGEVKIVKTSMRPELHISDEEKAWFNQVHCEVFWDGPFWLINAGRKQDNELKFYHRWQEVVDLLNEYFAGKVLVAQIGHSTHVHTPLKGAVNLVGKTDDLRQLIRLGYHAAGTIGPLSFQFVMSAALDQAAVCVAAGKEGVRWHIYPHIRHIYTNGALNCCSWDGCWLGGKAGQCKELIDNVPKCFRLIQPYMIADAVALYYEGGKLNFPTNDQIKAWTKRFLILEDDIQRQQAFRSKFFFHDVTIASTAAEAIELLQKQTFDVVSLDSHLGEGVDNGSLVAKFLAEHPTQSHIVVHCNEGPIIKQIQKFLPKIEWRPEWWR